MMTLTNFKTRLKVGLTFMLFAIAFYIVSSEDLLSYIVLVDHPGLKSDKILSLHLIANVGLLIAKGGAGVMLLRVYNRLKGKNIPFVGFLWIFAMWYFVMAFVFAMNLLSFWRVFIWIDGIFRATGGIVGLTSAYTLYRALPFIYTIKSPEEYGRLADEINALREENKRLETILHRGDHKN